MDNTYCVLNKNGLVVNYILWDGISSYNPGDNLTLINSKNAPQGVGIGWKKESSKWFMPIYNNETGEQTWTEIN